MIVLFVEAIPFTVLYGVSGCPLCRRSRFWLRFAGVVVAMLLPDLVAILARVGQQTGGILFLVGFRWGVLLALSSISVLFLWAWFRRGWGRR